MTYPRWQTSDSGYEALYPSCVRLHLYRTNISGEPVRTGIVTKGEVRDSDIQAIKNVGIDLKNAADELALWLQGMEDAWYLDKIKDS